MQLTELDHCIIAFICRDGPLSAYQVRKNFRESVTSFWSSSAGSIYPAISKLRSAGLVSAAEPSDGRGTQNLSVTAKGRRALAEWLAMTTIDLAGPTFDPIRTRVQFMSLVGLADRETLMNKWLTMTREAIATTKMRLEAVASDPRGRMECIGLQGGLYELEARERWLLSLADKIA